MNNDEKFSLDTFKRWMKDDTDTTDCHFVKPKNPLIGVAVESKISDIKRLLIKIETDEDAPEDIVEEFIENGGIIKDVEDKTFTVGLDSGGTFLIHRCYVKRI